MLDPASSSSQGEGSGSGTWGGSPKEVDPLPFHPDFASRSEDNVVLTSQDGTSFSFPFKTLISSSSFFRSLEHLPTFSPTGQVLIIPIPVATTDSLRLLLSALRPTLPDDISTLKPTPAMIGPLMRAVDAYDFHHALAVISATTASKSTSSLMSFVLAALTIDEDLAEEAALHTLSWDMAEFPGWASEVLMHWAPRFLARLYAYHAKCRRTLISGVPDETIRF